MPLTQPAEFEEEMSAAGFVDVAVEPVVGEFVAASVDDFVATMERSNATLVPVRAALGPTEWTRALASARAALVAAYGEGWVRGAMPAWLACGQKPER